MAQEQTFVKMATDAWTSAVDRAGKLFNDLTDEQLQKEIAPGKNTGTYLVGHLVAANDAMVGLLGGERSYAHLDEAFLKNPDKSGLAMPSAATLKENWNELHPRIAASFSQMQPADWFKRHTSVSDEDFAKEPHRNKLNVLITRTNHLSYHLGQVRLLQ